jgi:hypothetical protein
MIDFLFRNYIKEISGKSVVIVGSAPNPVMPEIAKDPNTAIICVKGGGLIAKELGMRDPNFTFTAEWGLEDNMRVLENCKTKYACHVSRNVFSRQYVEYQYSQANFQYERLYIFGDHFLPAVYYAERFQESDMEKGPLSFGIGMVIMAINFGAKDITIVGIDPFSSEKYYETNRPYNDAHNKPDAAALTLLNKESGTKIYTSKKDLAEKLNINYRP